MPHNYEHAITATELFTVINEVCQAYINKKPSGNSSKKKVAQCSTVWEGYHGEDGKQRATRLLNEAKAKIFAADLFELTKAIFEHRDGNWGARSLKTMLLEKLVETFGSAVKVKRNKTWAPDFEHLKV